MRLRVGPTVLLLNWLWGVWCQEKRTCGLTSPPTAPSQPFHPCPKHNSYCLPRIHKGYLLDELVCLKKINNAMRRVFLRLERLSWVCNPLKRLNVELEVAISHPFNQGHLPAASQASGPRPTGQRRKRNCFCAQPGLRWPRLQQGHLRSPTLQLGVTGNT